MDPTLAGWLLVVGVLLLVLAGAGVIHLIEWHLYTATRTERDMLRESLTAMTLDRDGWRSVGERALLVAQMGKQLSTRATRVARVSARVPEANI